MPLLVLLFLFIDIHLLVGRLVGPTVTLAPSWLELRGTRLTLNIFDIRMDIEVFVKTGSVSKCVTCIVFDLSGDTVPVFSSGIIGV